MAAVDPPALKSALAAHPVVDMPALGGHTNHVRAGVLVPLVWPSAAGGPTLILTLRTPELARHAGQVCFPGGRPEPQDTDLRATALREAREELDIRGARILGRLGSIPLFSSDYRIEPYVAAVPDGPFVPDPREVARVLRLELEALLDQARIDAIPWGRDGQRTLSPVFLADGEVVFGATAHVLLELVQVYAGAAGREPPPLQGGRYRWEDVFPRERGGP